MRRLPLTLCISLSACALCFAAAAPKAKRPAAPPEITFYVAPTGNDRWTGTKADVTTTAGRKDGPFLTLTRARDAVRALRRRQGNKGAKPMTVIIRAGDYHQREPIVFTPEDSGTEAAPVTWSAFKGEAPVISGGVPVTGWKAQKVNGKEAWIAKVPGRSKQPGTIRELWVNGTPRTRARHPNGEDTLAVAEVPDFTPQTDWAHGQDSFRFHDGDLEPWKDLANSELMLFSRWVESRLPVTAVDEADRRVRFSKKSVFSIQPDDRYHVEGALDFLDAPGEWHFDKASETLSYFPRRGEKLATAKVVVPSLTQVVRLEGDAKSGRSVEHLVFKGLTFSHSEWCHDSPGGWDGRAGFPQAASGVPGAVAATFARHLRFEDCRFVNAGNYGLELERGAQKNVVVGCEFAELGAGGVRIGEPEIRENEAEHAFGNEITDSRVHDCGRMFAGCVGIWIAQSYDNRIAYNEVFDLYYTGISAGFTWGYDKGLARGNVIEHNHVHHIGCRTGGRPPILSDMGFVYTLGVQPGTVIRNNRFHDSAGVRYGGWGIYLDEGSSDILVEKNLVYRTIHGSLHHHFGRHNIIRNNILAFAKDRQIERSRAEDTTSFTFERNIVVWQTGEAIMGNWDSYNADFDRNLWFRVGGGTDFRMAYLTLDQWKEKGKDRASIVGADPMFVDLSRDNYNLRSNSPALKLGFEPWDQSDVGPRKPSARKGRVVK